MENKVNRILQDKINLLSKQELEDLAESYLGKYAFILFDTKLNDGSSTLFTVSKIVGYESLRSWFPNGLDFDDKGRDRKIGDKTILFQLENGQSWELVDFATLGDTINVKDKSGDGYSNVEIIELNTTLLDTYSQVDGSRLFNLPISRTRTITPMLMDIGWLKNRNVGQQSMSQQTTFATNPTSTTPNKSNVLRYLGVSQEVSDGFPEDIKEFIEIIDGSQEIYAESKDSRKKEKLAELIVGWMRALMEFLKTQDLGMYAKSNVNLEQQTLPQNEITPTPQTPPSGGTPPPSGGTPPPSGGTPPPSGGTPPPSGGTPPPSPPPPQDEKPPYTKEELEDAIASADYMCEIGDEDACKDLAELRSIYNRYYS
jgi:hypothetical protein